MHFEIDCRHNYNHWRSVCNVVLATLLQRYQPYGGSIFIIIFHLMCLARMDVQEHHLCLYQALLSPLVLYLHLHSVALVLKL